MDLLLHESVYFTIFGLKIYMYGVMITLGILAGIALSFWAFKKRGLNTDHIVTIGLIAIPCAILGARIYYCVFYDRAYSFVDFINITSGGLAVYGAIIGGALAVLGYCLVKKLSFLKVADCIAPGLAIGQCLGRIGCYFGGCCYGQPTDFHVFPFAVIRDGEWVLATFFYESFATLLICIALIILLRKIKLDGFSFGAYFLLYGIARCIIEGFRGDSLYFLGMRVSQLLSGILIIASIIFIIAMLFHYKKKGLIVFGKGVHLAVQNSGLQSEEVTVSVQEEEKENTEEKAQNAVSESKSDKESE